jgi:hypothetical protein
VSLACFSSPPFERLQSRPDGECERKPVTILFTGIAGSTAIAGGELSGPPAIGGRTRQSAAVAEHGSVGARELRAGLNEISVKGMA